MLKRGDESNCTYNADEGPMKRSKSKRHIRSLSESEKNNKR